MTIRTLRHDFERSLPSRCFVLGALVGVMLAIAVHAAALEFWIVAAAAAVGAGILTGASRLIVYLDAPPAQEDQRWKHEGSSAQHLQGLPPTAR